MEIMKVLGRMVCTQRVAGLGHMNLRILENNKGKKLVAVDPVGAREGNSVKDIQKTVCWGHLETLNRCLPGRYKAPTYLMALIKRDIAKPNNY